MGWGGGGDTRAERAGAMRREEGGKKGPFIAPASTKEEENLIVL